MLRSESVGTYSSDDQLSGENSRLGLYPAIRDSRCVCLGIRCIGKLFKCIDKGSFTVKGSTRSGILSVVAAEKPRNDFINHRLNLGRKF
jgi:hypothetical protein